jgi:putative heme transporter
LTRRRLLLAAGGLALVVATVFWLLPLIADWDDVWDVVTQLTWGWVVALLAVTVVNLATFAPPWMVTLPGLRFIQAFELTQASTALSIVVPGGPAAGAAAAFGMLRSWRFARREITRALTLVSLWNQFLNLGFPIVAVFLLTISGEGTALLATAAFIGVAALGVGVTGFVLVLVSGRLAFAVGEQAARLASWALGKVRRGPVSWGGPSFERFRTAAGDLVRRRWHALTVASLVGSLSVFAVLLVSLRALNVPASEVSATEAFAAWALVRLLATIPITPGGIGVVELALTSTLVAFGGNNAGVVAAVLVFRFLTMVPTIVIGLVAAGTSRRHRRPVPEAQVGTVRP